MENILTKIHTLKVRWRDWFVGFAEKRRAEWWLALFSFIEAVFFPLPPDILMASLIVAHRVWWVRYITTTILFSILGGAFAYTLGLLFFESVGESIISFYGLEDAMRRVAELFNAHAFLAIFASAFTPIPYKVFTLSAGFFSIHFGVFLLASFIGRGLRFIVIGMLTKRYSDQIGMFVFRYFNILSLILIAAIILVVAVL